jgi:NtrC-family two-component system response regulator AlgB
MALIDDHVKERLAILIVDDEINIRKTLAYCLEAEGHSVASVSNFSDNYTACQAQQ